MLSWLFNVVASASLFDWLILATGGVALLYWIGTRNLDHFARHGFPFEKPLPFLGNAGCFILQTKSSTDFTLETYRRHKGKRAFGIFQFMKPVVILRDPELIKTVAVKEFDHFANHVPLTADKTDFLFSRNLFSLRDQEWRDMRATLSPAFTASKMRNVFKLIDTCGEQMVAFLRKQITSSSGGIFEAEMQNFFSRFANDVIATSAFGLQCDSLGQPENEFYKMGRELTSFNGLRGLILVLHQAFPKIMAFLGIPVNSKKLVSFFHNIIQGTISERQRKGIVRPDMLQLMMQARQGELKAEDEDEDETVKGSRKLILTNEDLSAQAVIFFFAGFDTVSIGLSFCAYALAVHREEQLRAQQEVDALFQRLEGKLTYEGVSELKYLDAFISEVFRLYTPSPITDRVCTKDFTIPAHEDVPEYTVKKGDLVLLPVYGLHMDPEYWTDPEKFDPNRFSDENKHNIKPFTYMPFGIGPRICIGSRFALMETKVALAHVLYNFNIVSTQRTQKKVIYDPSNLNPAIKGGFWVAFEERRKRNLEKESC